MFTGIVEETGTILDIQDGDKSSILKIKAHKVLKGLSIGDSIAVNGVCLTITAFTDSVFTAFVMAETLRRSNLKTLKSGTQVNLEAAMKVTSRLGGHIVSGHIDGIGEISSFQDEGDAIWMTINTNQNITRYIVEKGSIAIDGVSLTVGSVDDISFRVSIIPHTDQNTTLIRKREGDMVNLECDVIGKYVERLLGLKSQNEPSGVDRLDMKFLEQNGFL
ncbi:MAG: riboflavin synthase [Spirochaetia bacterium]|jgi:riboflavin synthase|nr:riboflavin synthase [Spirochaetia bacterium]